MLCAVMNTWPFTGGPGKATAAQVAMFAEVWLDKLPKTPQGMKQVDPMTWDEWQTMWKDKDNGIA